MPLKAVLLKNYFYLGHKKERKSYGKCPTGIKKEKYVFLKSIVFYKKESKSDFLQSCRTFLG